MAYRNYNSKLISIHAPSRERPTTLGSVLPRASNFNPRSLAGATPVRQSIGDIIRHFNPRSLAGATYR